MTLLKEPPATLAVQVIVPVGAEGVPVLVSVTVTVRVIVVPATREAELGDTVVVVLLSTDRLDFPELETCAASPEYFALTESLPVVVGEVYVTEQELALEEMAAREHELVLKLPPERLAFQDMVPVGAVTEPLLVSATVAVSRIDAPTITLALLGATTVLVHRGVVCTALSNVPLKRELGAPYCESLP